MSVEMNKATGAKFFREQDRLRGGPARYLCAPDYRAEIAGHPPLDFAAHEQFARAFYAGFSDLSHRIDDVVSNQERVAVRFTICGTHDGDFMGIPATGRRVEVSAMAVMRIVNGQVAQVDGVFDQLGMMRQLGVLPASV